MWILHLYFHFVPTVMQNVQLNLPFSWRAGIPEIAHSTLPLLSHILDIPPHLPPGRPAKRLPESKPSTSCKPIIFLPYFVFL